MSQAPHEDEHAAFFEALFSDPPERLILPAEAGQPSVNFSSDIRWRECRIWEGYMDASRLLLEQMLTRGSNSQSLIFPAMFNFRHGIEVALKWHIRYAGGTIPKHAGHDLKS